MEKGIGFNEDPSFIDLNHGEEYPLILGKKKEFIESIASLHGIPSNLVLPSNGSEGSLLSIFLSYALKSFRDGKIPSIILDSPNFIMDFNVAEDLGYNIIRVPRTSEMFFDKNSFISHMKEKVPDLVILTTPNNPLGMPIPDKDLLEVLSNLPNSSLAVIDRTLFNLDNEVSDEKILSDYSKKRIIILRSFSKEKSLSSERVAYMLFTNNKDADYLRSKINLGFNVHALGLAIKALSNDIVEDKIRKRITESLKEINKIKEIPGVTLFNSRSNYVLVKLPKGFSATKLISFLKERKLSVMGGNFIGLSDSYVRISMGGKENVALFVGALREFLVSN